MDDYPRGIEETDAVHHRLAGESPAVEKNFQCYDCSQSFHSLVDIGNHSHSYPWHSVEICLKCSDPITVSYAFTPARNHFFATKTQICIFFLFKFSRFFAGLMHHSTSL
ncbi:hypothetical protein OUZ56_014357 [Daphnia magna]|uniref:C2H2-type domain-containing protein n=1 Tax=Daphnia magna TaxID=35525 RepID=A0ABR0AJH5_9CRUS|nr:hypothetical protein OUZ56_014357 [Daphnia magna]